jgi:hypothetical protein
MRKTIILRAALLLAAFTLAEVSSAIAKPRQIKVTTQACENSASSCLETCAGIDFTTKVGSQQYGNCVVKCDGKRNYCMTQVR